MPTWTINGRTWGYRQEDVPGQPYYLMGSQLFKVWHLLMADIGATVGVVASSASGAASAKTAAEAARDTAQGHATAASNSAAAAGTARTAAEAARDAAQGHANTAGTAKDDAVTARNAAQGHANTAGTAKDDAVAARDAAQGHANTAGTAKDDAVTARNTAQDHATAAGLSKTGAEAAQLAASGSAGAAAADKGIVAGHRTSVEAALATAQGLVGAAGTGTATGLLYAAATKSLSSDTDVAAVCLYDTALDTDGGDWTDGCQATSWYREALGEGTRGATRRHPRAAAIFLRQGGNKIQVSDVYDLGVGGAPRPWIAFPAGTGLGAVGGGVGAMRAVTARNGRIYVARQDGLWVLNMLADRARVYTDVGVYQSPYTIGQRGSSGTASTQVPGLAGLGSSDCRDVFVRVLPGTALGSCGLPTPTVVVATAAGFSVIYPNGSVFDVGRTGGYTRVNLTDQGEIWAVCPDGSVVERGPLPYADVANTAWRTAVFANDVVVPNGTAMQLTDGAMGGLGTGLVLLADDPDPAAAMSARIGLTHATGWMPFQTRGAWLCDTVTGNIAASGELVTNWDFASGTSGWTTVGAATPAVVSGELEVTSTGAAGPGVQQVIATVIGQTYSVRCLARRGTTANAVTLLATGVGMANVSAAHSATSTTPLEIQFTATATTTQLWVYIGGTPASGQTAYFDTISCRLAVPDRSYKGKALVVYGLLSRTALSCGLAYFSGFGLTNYAEQAYTSDLDYGTGDFHYTYWMRATDGPGWYWQRGVVGGGGASIGAFLAAGKLSILVSDGTSSTSVTSTTPVNTNVWRLVAIVRRGNNLELWIDGEREATASLAGFGTLSNTAAVLRIGAQVVGSSSNTAWHCIAFRLGAGALSQAHIRMMFEDERALIIGGAPATLGGTSTNITSLTKVGNTRVVGSGDGVSVFAGLGRVAYHDGTTAGAAIASDSIVGVSGAPGYLLVATAAGVGLISDALIARDKLTRTAPRAVNGNVIRGWGVTTSTGPLYLAPRLYVGEREKLTVLVTVEAKSAGATATQRGRYVRQATVYRDAGGNITLDGAVKVIGDDQEVSAGADATLALDTATQTLAVQVTAADASRTIWVARMEVMSRISEGDRHAA